LCVRLPYSGSCLCLSPRPQTRRAEFVLSFRQGSRMSKALSLLREDGYVANRYGLRMLHPYRAVRTNMTHSPVLPWSRILFAERSSWNGQLRMAFFNSCGTKRYFQLDIFRWGPWDKTECLSAISQGCGSVVLAYESRLVHFGPKIAVSTSAVSERGGYYRFNKF